MYKQSLFIFRYVDNNVNDDQARLRFYIYKQSLQFALSDKNITFIFQGRIMMKNFCGLRSNQPPWTS